jgi:hypothetical protein
MQYFKQHQNDSSLYYARLAFANAGNMSQKSQVLEASNLLVNLFRNKNMSDSVIFYLDKAAIFKDNLFGPENLRHVQLFALQEQERQQKILQELNVVYQQLLLLDMLIMERLHCLILFANHVLLKVKRVELRSKLQHMKLRQSMEI